MPRRPRHYDPTVRVIRGRLGLAPVGDFSDPVLRDLSPVGNLWPQVCRPCHCESCEIKRALYQERRYG
jgi:hypothetical protein